VMEVLVPDMYLESIHQLDHSALKEAGIKAVIFDLDNTLCEWRYGQPNPGLRAFFKDLTAAGLAAAIVSNSPQNRVDLFAKDLDVPAVGSAGKPGARAFRKAMSILRVGPDETGVVGDQLLTDVLGGNRLGLYTVLVVPVSRREFPGTKVTRMIERLILRWMVRRGLVEGGILEGR